MVICTLDLPKVLKMPTSSVSHRPLTVGLRDVLGHHLEVILMGLS
jgi:hypothetical protein